jgi:hypothetical protein
MRLVGVMTRSALPLIPVSVLAPFRGCPLCLGRLTLAARYGLPEPIYSFSLAGEPAGHADNGDVA